MQLAASRAENEQLRAQLASFRAEKEVLGVDEREKEGIFELGLDLGLDAEVLMLS